MTDNRTIRNFILARRARWIAATVACAGLSAGALSESGCCPLACLKIDDSEAGAIPPGPCLQVRLHDAGLPSPPTSKP